MAAYPVGSLANGNILMSDGTQRSPQSSQSNPNAANYRIPASSQSTERNAAGNPLYQNSPLGSVLGATTGGGATGGGGAPAPAPAPAGGGGGVNFDALIQQQRDLAKAAYEEGVRRASSAFDQARGLYDSGVQALGKKKDEFKTLFDQGGAKILDRFEQERGNLQTSAKNADTTSRNTLRALGMGGSAVIKSEGAQRQNNAKAYGGLSTTRNENDQANQGEYDSRLNWASGQESALQAALRQAQEAKTAAENQSGLIYAGDVGGINSNINNFLGTILQNQLALQTANAGTASKVANPYAVNIPDLTNSLSAQLPQTGGGGTQASAGNVATPTTLAQLLELQKKSGVAGGGLYA